MHKYCNQSLLTLLALHSRLLVLWFICVLVIESHHNGLRRFSEETSREMLRETVQLNVLPDSLMSHMHLSLSHSLLR